MEKRIQELIEERQGIRLDIGCGAAKQDGFVGMDMQDLPGVDIVHNWNDHPWPLPDESVIVAMASHALEHVNPADNGVLNWMNELWRVCKPNAKVAISYPHGSSQGYLQDPTHCNPMNENVWLYFDPLETTSNGVLYKFYRPKPWKIVAVPMANPSSNVEVILAKRREDDSYYE